MRATSPLAIVITGLITCLLLDSCASGAGAPPDKCTTR
jgi:hypothetical protein